MILALRLAARGRGETSPNPMVGAVVAKSGRIVGRGWHRRYGAPHAEVEALWDAGSRARGATLYVNLEPCAHTGKTPPCTDAILSAGISRVVAAMADPNPHVNGGGARLLSRKGVDVDLGLLEDEARELNRGFVSWAAKGRPMITLKLAASLDGRIATRKGDSKWITGPEARREAHRLRAEHDAVVAGGATVRADDPELTVRHVRGRNPARIVLDPSLATSPRSRWLAQDGARRVLVAGRHVSAGRRRLFEETGAEIWTVPLNRDGGIQLKAFARLAAKEGLLSLLVEGGGRLAGAFLAKGLVDRIRLFTAPVILGGDARGWTPGLRPSRVEEGLRLKGTRIRKLGDDWLVQGDV